ncbi:MAG: FtsX-like permease family protein [Acidobacteria bacterium]|nr:FtsX-like permease family protein [Acidobacteriota bacterium]
MLQHFPLIWKNSVRNKRRSLLTIVSIAASLCLLAVLGVLYHVFFLADAAPEQAQRLIVRNKVSLTNPLPLSYREKIKQVPGVAEVMIYQWFGGTYIDPSNFFARAAIEPEKLLNVYSEYKVPDDQWKAFVADRSGCLLGRKTAERYNLKIGDRVPLIGDIFPVNLTFTVRAIYDAYRDNENLLFHFEYLNESMRTSGQIGRSDLVGTYVIRMTGPEHAASISRAIDDMFRNAPLPTKTETERAFEVSFLAFIGNVKLFMMVISAAITFTILLVAANTMAMSVRERLREVGVLKTLGFTQGGVLSILMGEAIVISLLGGGIGLGLAGLLCRGLSGLPSTFVDMTRFTLTPAVAAGCMAVALVIGVVSSFVPAWNASRRNILEALRVTD